MKHQLTPIEDGLFVVNAERTVEIDLLQRRLLDLADSGVMTFGSANMEILKPELYDAGYSIEGTPLCLDDDISIGLQMPDTWYLNKGTNALSISMYYNFLTFKEQAKVGVLFSKNKPASDRFGRIGAIEVYMREPLELFLLSNGINYFGTPKTLTECMRVLEGWDTSRVKRLKSYLSYSDFIQLWSESNFPNYRASEWRLGRQISEEIFANTGTTNVREGVRFFWQNYLLQRDKKISAGDVEIDVLGRLFYEKRQPQFVLLGEDVFSESETGEVITFRHFSEDKTTSVCRRVEKNEKDLETARLAKKMFPDSAVAVIRNPADMPAFTMCKLDEIKQGVSREVAVVAEALTQLINK